MSKRNKVSELRAAQMVLGYYFVVDGDSGENNYNERVLAVQAMCLDQFTSHQSSDDSNVVISLFLNLIKIDRMVVTLFNMGAHDTSEVLAVGRNWIDGNLRKIVSNLTGKSLLMPNVDCYEDDFTKQFSRENRKLVFLVPGSKK